MNSLAPSTRSGARFLVRRLGPLAALAVLLTTCERLLGPSIPFGSIVPIIHFEVAPIDSVFVAVGEKKTLTVDNVMVDGVTVEIGELNGPVLVSWQVRDSVVARVQPDQAEVAVTGRFSQSPKPLPTALGPAVLLE